MSNISKTRDMLINEFLKCLEEDKLPWERGWNIIHHYNPISNHTYLGNNSLLLSIVADLENYTDPRWMTYNQIKEKGFILENAKGKGVPIEFWSAYDKVDKRNITQVEANEFIKNGEEERIKYVCRNYYVFNATHINGIEPLQTKKVCIENQNIEKFIKTYLKNEGIYLSHGGNSALYSPKNDIIKIPLLSSFENEMIYFDVLLHEVGHSTGHENRLNRNLKGQFGTTEYAKEELRAELSSAFLNAELGLGMSEMSLNRHKAYIQDWIQLIKDKPNELFKAIKESEKIVDFIKIRGDFEKIIPEISIGRKVDDKKEIHQTSIKERMEQAKNTLRNVSSNKNPYLQKNIAKQR